MTSLPGRVSQFRRRWPDKIVGRYNSVNQGNGQIWRIDFGAATPSAELFLDPPVYRTFGVTLSSDGRKMVMAHDPSNWTYNNYLDSYDFGSGVTTRILPSDGFRDFFPDYSPTRDEIAWSRGTSTSCCGDPLDLWVINGDGSDPHNLTPNSATSHENPRFSPNGEQIFFHDPYGPFIGSAAIQSERRRESDARNYAA